MNILSVDIHEKIPQNTQQHEKRKNHITGAQENPMENVNKLKAT